ncbi:MAG: Uncharacterised protein [Cyanobium sp. ARS6]|nr:MAG: Uncharacterised protein [Cyanobium sp. ARS6]
MLQKLRSFVQCSVPPHPGGEFLRQQRIKDREALLELRLATTQHHHISAGHRSTAFFRKRAVGSYQGFKALFRIETGCQRDQAAWAQVAESCIHMLATQVLAGMPPIHVAETCRHSFCEWWRADGQIAIHYSLASCGNQLCSLNAGDRSIQAPCTHQLLFNPGRLPDQQAERVGTDVVGLISRPELFEVAGYLGGRQFEGGLKRELG